MTDYQPPLTAQHDRLTPAIRAVSEALAARERERPPEQHHHGHPVHAPDMVAIASGSSPVSSQTVYVMEFVFTPFESDAILQDVKHAATTPQTVRLACLRDGTLARGYTI